MGQSQNRLLCQWSADVMVGEVEVVVVEAVQEEGTVMKTVTAVVMSVGSTLLCGGYGGLRGKKESWCWWHCGGVQGFLSPLGHLLHSPH